MKKQITINYAPNSEHQRKFHNSESFERLLLAGFGSGKTLAGCAETVKLSAINYGLSSLIISPTYPIMIKSVIPTFENLLITSEIDYTHNQSKKMFYIKDFDHTIWYQSAEDPTSLKGSNVCSLYIDESASIRYESYLQAIGRVREPKARKLCIYHTTTPEQMNWLYDEFFKTKDDSKEIIQGSTYANKDLPASYIKSLESRYSSELRELYLEGKFISFGGKVIKPEWFRKFSFDNKKDWIINYTIDTAYGKEGSDNTGILEYSILNDNLYLWDYHEVNLMFPDLVKFITDLVRRNPRYKSSRISIEPKASGLSIIQQLNASTDFSVVQSKPPTESKYSRAVAYTGVLESGRVYQHEFSDWDRFNYECSQFTREELYADEAVDCLVMALQEREKQIVNTEDLIFKPF